MGHPPTPEQQHAIDLAATGTSVVIEALAGTGKTSTLAFVAEALPEKYIQYVAFNKAIVTEAQGRFPDNVTASTAHSLAFRALGKHYGHRLRGGRMKSFEIAQRLRLPANGWSCTILGTRKQLAAGFLGGLVMRSLKLFVQTADPEPTTAHVPTVPGIDEPTVKKDPRTGKEVVVNRRGANNRDLALWLEPYLQAAWRDIANRDGALPFSHGDYLKLWQLSGPRITTDVILYDEAQDANPCMLDIVNQQDAQLIFVGDTFQQIYEWNGAVNALASADPDAPRAHLTESFRFGPEVAEVANVALDWLGCEYPLKGRGPANVVGPIDEPDVILFRTNAKAVGTALQEIRAGTRVAIVGGADETIQFAKSADLLKRGQKAYHPDLACFDTWGEVQDYVANDPNGSELKTLVDLCDNFGADMIIAELGHATDERYADLVLTTAHKAKGREWDAVQLAGDFPDPDERDLSTEDVRLLYVAATRAKKALDVTGVGFYNRDHEEGPDGDAR